MEKKECENALYELSIQYEKEVVYLDEINGYVDILNDLIESYFNPKPYKFEDLKVGMWVWDEKEKLCGKVVHKNLRKFSILSTPGYSWGKFEENRFFPLTKAMYRKEDEE